MRTHTVSKKYVLGNEDGSVLVISLVMLALLVILGISATTTSNIENLVTRNVEQYTVALHRAEAAAMEGIQMLQNADPNPRTDPAIGTGNWLNQTVGEVTEGEILTSSYWSGTETPPIAGGIANTLLLAGSEGVVGSLDMGKSNVHSYTVYGRGQSDRGGLVIIGVGYRRAF